MADHIDDRIAYFGDVVWRDVRCHPDGNSRSAVHQQGRQPGRKHGWFFQRLVEVLAPVDRVAVDVAEHHLGYRRKPTLGVAHGSGGIAIDRAVVSLPIDKWISQRKRLRHSHLGVVDRLIAVRVVLAKHLSNKAGALLVRRGRSHTLIVHRVQDSTLDGLEPVSNVGKGPRYDYAHRVVQVGRLHLVFNTDWPDITEVATDHKNLRLVFFVVRNARQRAAHRACVRNEQG